MKHTLQKTATAIASGALILTSAMPAFASVDISINGNGSDSTSDVDVDKTSTTVVTQTNQTSIHNDINATANTGGNEIDGTTGGDASITTGDATVEVDVDNTANSNVAMVENCDCDDDLMVDISANGADTDNDADVESHSATVLMQDNQADFDNEVDAEAETGDNDVDGTTGGDVDIDSGDATVDVDVTNEANGNVGAISGSNGGSESTFWIRRNGVRSDNDISVLLSRQAFMGQTNETDLHNDVDGDAETGENGAEGTTGGEVDIDTGDASVDVMVENTAGFNEAWADCDCLTTDVSAEVKKNGSDSENDIEAELHTALVVEQENTCGTSRRSRLLRFFKMKKNRGGDECFDNHVNADADTGNNHADGSTSGDGDPSIDTGHSFVTATATNFGGFNSYNTGGFSWWD